MNLQDAFAEKIIPLKDKLSEQDYKMLLEVAEDYGHGLLRANIIAHIINSGISVNFYWQEFKKDEYRIYWEADNKIDSTHIDCAVQGYGTAEEAMKIFIEAIQNSIKEKEAALHRIMRPN
jgi:hypothetical protein